MIEQTRNEKKLLLIERTKFRLKQGLERIDHEYEIIKPLLMEFKAKAQLPELPSEVLVDVEWVDDAAPEDQG